MARFDVRAMVGLIGAVAGDFSGRLPKSVPAGE